MPGRTPAEAVREYVDTIQLAISCVTNAVADVKGGYYVSDTPHILELNGSNPIRISGTSGVWLILQQYYRIVQSEAPTALWTVAEEGYYYEILDSDHREILAYHWHPTGLSSYAAHHLHIGHGAIVGREELHHAHLPSGHVSVPDILRLLISDFRASPRRHDWRAVLASL